MKPAILLRPRAIATEYGVSRRTVHRLMRDPDFPAAIRLSRRTLLFKRSELEAYFERKRQSQNLQGVT